MPAPVPEDDHAAKPDAPDAAGRTAHQAGSHAADRSGALAVLAALAEALAGLPSDADDAALLQAIGGALIPALADVCHLHTVADSTGQLALVAVAPRDSAGIRPLLTALDVQATAMLVYEPLLDDGRPVLLTTNDSNSDSDISGDTEAHADAADHRTLLDAAGLGWELALPLGGGRADTAAPGALLVVGGAGDRAVPPEPLALAAVLAGLVDGWRAASVERKRACGLQAHLEDTAIAGRELAHTLNNGLTMPVGVIELLLDRSALSAELQEMIQAAASDLQALERHIRAFQEQMRSHSGGRVRTEATLPPP